MTGINMACKTFAIICDARKGHEMGIDTLALVDRTKSKKEFWTSDQSYLIMRFFHRNVAARVCARFRYNNPRVVDFQQALNIIGQQTQDIADNLCDNDFLVDKEW